MVFGKGAGPMGAAGSVFDRPKNEELQTADGKRSETEEMNGGETQLVSCCPEITDMLNSLVLSVAIKLAIIWFLLKIPGRSEYEMIKQFEM